VIRDLSRRETRSTCTRCRSPSCATRRTRGGGGPACALFGPLSGTLVALLVLISILARSTRTILVNAAHRLRDGARTDSSSPVSTALTPAQDTRDGDCRARRDVPAAGGGAAKLPAVLDYTTSRSCSPRSATPQRSTRCAGRHRIGASPTRAWGYTDQSASASTSSPTRADRGEHADLTARASAASASRRWRSGCRSTGGSRGARIRSPRVRCSVSRGESP